MNKKLCDLTENEFAEVQKTYFSIFPLIYYKLERPRYIDFNFNNKKIGKLFSALMIEDNIVKNINSLIINTAYDLFISSFDNSLKKGVYISGKHKSLHFFKNYYNIERYFQEFAKTFFAYNFSTKNYFRARRKAIEDSYHIDKFFFKTDFYSAYHWRHDGWTNNYYNVLVDHQAREKIEKKLKKRFLFLKEETPEEYCRNFVNLAYRYHEINQDKKAKRILRRMLFMLRFKIAVLASKDDTPIYDRKIFSIISSLKTSYGVYLRFYLNALMFIYKASKTNFIKKMRIKKLIRKQSLRKIYHREFKAIKDFGSTTMVSASRPQHLIKLIEIRIDLWSLLHSKRKKQLIMAEIKFLFAEVIKSIKYGYYGPLEDESNFERYYFIISELYLELFNLLEKIYNVDIRSF